MNGNDLKKILKKNPEYHYINLYDEEFDQYELVDLNKSDLQKAVSSYEDYQESFFYDDEEGTLYLYRLVDGPYHITVDDMLGIIDSLIKDEYEWDAEEIRLWMDDLERNLNFEPIFLPRKNLNVDDFLFDDDDYLVSLIRKKLEKLNKVDTIGDLENLQKAVLDILDKRNTPRKLRQHSKEALSFILENIDLDMYSSKEKIDFYKKNIVKLAKEDVQFAMKELGYCYYEGSHGFETDFGESLYWLDKYYELTKDPFVANSIGYIYYYGRTTEGVPQKDKAFQYFAIGTLAGGSIEATYKLSDCYLKGYGTPINYQAAYNLVSGMYDECYERFLEGDNNKFADIALRMGNFYRDGIYVRRDLKKALEYYLIARVAIHRRLLADNEYIGDRNVAFSIYHNIEEVSGLLRYERGIDETCFVLPDELEYVSVTEDGKYKIKQISENQCLIIIKRKGNKKFCFSLPEASCAAVVDEARLFVQFSYIAEEDLEILKKGKVLAFYIELKTLKAFVEFDKDTTMVCVDLDEVRFIPPESSAGTLYKLYAVEFLPHSRIYEYLSNDDLHIGDTAFAGENEVIVKDIKYLYGDELPLPLSKMAKIKAK